MKKHYFLFIALTAMLTLNLKATVLTVSNNTNSPGQYTALQTAIDAASPNDTILVAGSPTSYGSISIGKTLILFGAGYHNPYGNNTTIGDIALYNTNLGYSTASGSKIIGFIANQITLNGDFYGSVDTTRSIVNVMIERCSVSKICFGIQTNSSNSQNIYKNVTIRNCIIANAITNGYYSLPNTSPNYPRCNVTLNNIFVYNNIFNGAGIFGVYISGQSGNVLGSPVINDFYVRNNIFINKIGSNCFNVSGNSKTSYSNLIIENNIFYAAEPQGTSGSVFTKNITYMCLNNTIPGTGNIGSGNMVNANPLFVNYPLMGQVAFDWAHDFHLQATSPGKNAGTDGTDIGIYGGMMPFEVGANPYIPQMMELTLPNGSSVPAGGTLNVHFKARKQN